MLTKIKSHKPECVFKPSFSQTHSKTAKIPRIYSLRKKSKENPQIEIDLEGLKEAILKENQHQYNVRT